MKDLKGKAVDALKVYLAEMSGLYANPESRYQVAEVGDCVVAASITDEDEINLEVYTDAKLIEWYLKAWQFLHDLPKDEQEDYSIGAAMHGFWGC